MSKALLYSFLKQSSINLSRIRPVCLIIFLHLSEVAFQNRGIRKVDQQCIICRRHRQFSLLIDEQRRTVIRSESSIMMVGKIVCLDLLIMDGVEQLKWLPSSLGFSSVPQSATAFFLF